LGDGLTGGTQDLELFRLVFPLRLEVTAIRQIQATGGGESFLILQPGDVLDEAPSYDSNRQAVGFSILSPSPSAQGADLLPTITLPRISNLAPFFGQGTPTEETYGGWLNQTGALSTYELNFETRTVAIPEPSSFFLAAFSFLLAVYV